MSLEIVASVIGGCQATGCKHGWEPADEAEKQEAMPASSYKCSKPGELRTNNTAANIGAAPPPTLGTSAMSANGPCNSRSNDCSLLLLLTSPSKDNTCHMEKKSELSCKDPAHVLINSEWIVEGILQESSVRERGANLQHFRSTHFTTTIYIELPPPMLAAAFGTIPPSQYHDWHPCCLARCQVYFAQWNNNPWSRRWTRWFRLLLPLDFIFIRKAPKLDISIYVPSHKNVPTCPAYWANLLLIIFNLWPCSSGSRRWLGRREVKLFTQRRSLCLSRLLSERRWFMQAGCIFSKCISLPFCATPHSQNLSLVKSPENDQAIPIGNNHPVASKVLQV